MSTTQSGLANVEAALARTLDDRSLTRTERQALRALLEAEGPGERERARLTAHAFALARDAVEEPRAREVLEWLEDVLKAMRPAEPDGANLAEALFSPGDNCRRRIASLIQSATSTIDVCVFTITDHHVSKPLIDAHRRGVRVRVLTDNDKSQDLGSDIDDLERAGVPVTVDTSPYHMHHKFAIYDDKVLLTGSYNWTRGAAEMNEENFVVTDDPRLVAPFRAEFDTLWQRHRPR